MEAISLKKEKSFSKVLGFPGLGIAKDKLYEIVLRIGIACAFVGHGIFALDIKEKWIPLITVYGFSENTAIALLPIIGCMDLLIAWALLVFPIRAVVIWAIIWPFTAALSYTLSGSSVFEFVERAPNWILPLSLLWKMGFPNKISDLWRIR